MSTTYDITTINNDTYSGVEFTVLVNNVALNLTGYTMKMQVRKRYGDIAVITIDTTKGLTITSAAAGKFKIDSQIFSVAIPDTYLYDIQFTDLDKNIKTYISGNFTIIGDVTQ
jgi:hypothetical protein